VILPPLVFPEKGIFCITPGPGNIDLLSLIQYATETFSYVAIKPKGELILSRMGSLIRLTS
jgi:hypothetical protein